MKRGQHVDVLAIHRGFGQQYGVLRLPRTGAHASILVSQHAVPHLTQPVAQLKFPLGEQTSFASQHSFPPQTV